MVFGHVKNVGVTEAFEIAYDSYGSKHLVVKPRLAREPKIP